MILSSITTNIYNIASKQCTGGLCFCAAYYKCFDEIEYGLLSIPYSSIPTFGSPTKVVSSPLPHLSSTLADGCSAAQRARHDGLRGDATRSRVLPTEPYGFFSTRGSASVILRSHGERTRIAFLSMLRFCTALLLSMAKLVACEVKSRANGLDLSMVIRSCALCATSLVPVSGHLLSKPPSRLAP